MFSRQAIEVKVGGYLRTRADWLYNLDLDRGLTPSGQPLFAVPLSDPNGQSLFSADLRVRTDLAVYAPWAPMAVKVRADLVDDLVMGSTPVLTGGSGSAPSPATSPGQIPSTLLRIKRAYGEVLLPFGLLSAGRMGAHWGLGLLANGGDAVDANLSDAADRVALVSPIAGHLWALAFDFGAVGPTATRKDGQRSLVFDNSADVRALTFALMNVRTPEARERRRLAGRWTAEYGLTAAYKWQDNDVPETYLDTTFSRPLTAASVMRRGYQAGAFDAWARLEGPWLRVELEAAVLLAQIEQPSLIPGVLLRDQAYSAQWGGALEVQVGAPESRLVGGVDVGVASGDPAPGMGAYPQGTVAPQPGELDGPQADVPRDVRVDNLRFHPDYRVDRILFAEIVGTVTDAFYVRPWARLRLLEWHTSSLNLRASVTGSRALYASSTPGQDPNLGVEAYAALRWESRDGFDVLLEYAALFPLAGLSNPSQNLTAQPAQLLRARVAWIF